MRGPRPTHVNVTAMFTLLVALGAAAATGPAVTAPYGTVTRFPQPAADQPREPVAGPDGHVWYVEGEGGRVGRVSTAGDAGLVGGVERAGSIATGPDGAVWFTASEPGGAYGLPTAVVGRIGPDGRVTHHSRGLSPGADLDDITAGPDGNLWFTDPAGGRVGRITPSGEITEFSAGITARARPSAIAAGPDGNVWFTEPGTFPLGGVFGNRIGRITPAGVVTEFSAGITPYGAPNDIVAGPDGNLWFTESIGNRIARITPQGVVTEFDPGTVPASGGFTSPFSKVPVAIAVGPDGNVWVAEAMGILARVGPDGTIVDHPVPGARAGSVVVSSPSGIAAGADGNLWFTESGNPTAVPPLRGRISRFTLVATVDPPAPVAAAPATPPVAPAAATRRLFLTVRVPRTARRGGRVTVSLRVRNTGTAPTSRTVVSLLLPHGLAIDAASRAANRRVRPAVRRFRASGRTLVFRLGTVPRGRMLALRADVAVAVRTPKGARLVRASVRADRAKAVAARAVLVIR